ncbi:helix-turn-helix domain-containing protein [Haloferacaceae archaeon DSL9]
MHSVTLDMVQYDCPYIAVTDDLDVSFYTMHWDFNTAQQELETRILVKGADRDTLTNGLAALKDHERMRGYDLLSRQGEKAVIKSSIAETSAMRAVRANDGYITGPFSIRDGSEIWNVGFDDAGATKDGLAELEVDNDFEVESETAIGLEDYLDVVQHAGAAKDVFDTCRGLTPVERRTLETAVEHGYFESPRGATLETLADAFSISKTAVSKNLRRTERKVFPTLVETLSELDGDARRPTIR